MNNALVLNLIKSNKMKKTLLLILQPLMFICSYGQCDITDIIPFKTGKTKFQTLSVVNSLKIKRDESMYPIVLSPDQQMQNWSDLQRTALQAMPEVLSRMERTYENYLLYDGCNSPTHQWLKPDYLKDDSIYISYSYLKWDNAPCLKGSNRRLTLSFADDTMYAISMTFEYSPEEFNTLQTDYNMLDNLLKKKYPYVQKSVSTLTSESMGIKKTEQNGEGFCYTPKSYKGLKNKIDEYRLSYEWDDYFKKYYLVIRHINTNHTKFSKGEVTSGGS